MRKRPRRVRQDVLAAIQGLASDIQPPALPNAAEIHRALARRFPDPDDLPSERTIRDILAELRGVDDGEPWAFPAAVPDAIDAALVLPVLARLMQSSRGGRRGVTVGEARWITAIRRAAPGLDPRVAFELAREYLLAAAGKADRADLDAFLAFAPWESGAARSTYEAALGAKWIGPPLAWLRQTGEEAVTGSFAALASADALDRVILERRRAGQSVRATARTLHVTAQRVRDAEEWDQRQRAQEGTKP